jgi:hypothetical protein
LRKNKITKGLVALERLFDNKDRVTLKQLLFRQEDVEEINFGTKIAPKKVYIGKRISPKIRIMIIYLLKKYKHVFYWSYEDLSMRYHLNLIINLSRKKKNNKSHPKT